MTALCAATSPVVVFFYSESCEACERIEPAWRMVVNESPQVHPIRVQLGSSLAAHPPGRVRHAAATGFNASQIVLESLVEQAK